MNEFTVLIYLVFFVALFAATFAYIFKMMTTTLQEFDKVSNPGNVKQNLHPEMRDVKSGESLLVFNPQQDDDDDDDDEGDVIIVRK